MSILEGWSRSENSLGITVNYAPTIGAMRAMEEKVNCWLDINDNNYACYYPCVGLASLSADGNFNTCAIETDGYFINNASGGQPINICIDEWVDKI